MAEKLTCSVHHVGLTTPVFDQARAFFCDVLGFDVVGNDRNIPQSSCPMARCS